MPGNQSASEGNGRVSRVQGEAVLNSIPDAFIALDWNGLITFINRRAVEFLQTKYEDLIGRNLWELYPQLKELSIFSAFQRAQTEGRPVMMEFYDKPNKTWYDIHIYPTTDGLAAYSHDITEEKHAREELRRSEARFSGMISIAADAIISIDDDQRIILFNQGAEDIFGYEAKEVLGEPLDILLPENVREIHRHHIQKFATSSVSARRMGERRQVSGRRKSGDIFPADASIMRVEIEGVRQFSVVLRDVTESMRIQEALRQANEHIQALIEASPLAIVTMDREHRVQIWNRAAETMFGWSYDEVIDENFEAINENYRVLAAQIVSARGEPQKRQVETMLRRRDGSPLWVHVSVAPLRDEEGLERGSMAIVEDFTQRKATEDARKRLTAILEFTPDYVGIAHPHGRITYLNRAWRQLLEIEDDAVTEWHIGDVHPEWASALILRDAIPTAIRKGSWSGETAILDDAGHEIPVLQVVIAHRDPQGCVDYLSTVIRSIVDRKRAEEFQDFIAAASHTLAGSLNFDELLPNVTELPVPTHADFCVIELLPEEGQPPRVSAAHHIRSAQALIDGLEEFPLSLEMPMGPARAIRTGKAELVSEVSMAWLKAMSQSEEHFEVLRDLQPHSIMIVPLRARGRIIGVMTFAMSESCRTYGPDDLVLAEDLAGRVALAIDNAKLYQNSFRLRRCLRRRRGLRRR